MTLKELRESVGLKQDVVAKRLSVSPTAVSQWERGANGIARKHVLKLARLYKTTADTVIAASKASQGDGR